MKIAYFSPLNPQKSGISDFSEELILELCKWCEIEIFTSNVDISNSEIKNKINVHLIGDYYNENVRDKFDLAVFHVGNNYQFHKEIVECFMKFGGVLELHDIALHHYLAEETVVQGKHNEYMQIMQYCHGKKGKTRAEAFLSGRKEAPWEKESLEYMVNKRLIDRADGIIVHSEFAKQMIRGIRRNVPLYVIELHASEIKKYTKDEKDEIKEKLGLPKNCLIMGAFGYASKEKRIVQILEALKQYCKYNKQFHFAIVGKVAGIDIETILEMYGLQDKVTITGFVDLELFKEYMIACDIAFNLRYPTQGESSASLARLLGMGKAVFVTNVGTFMEYPDDVVMKVEHGDEEIKQIYDGLLKISENIDEYQDRAYKYALKNNNLKINSKMYIDCFTKIKNHAIQVEEFEDKLLDIIFDMRLTNSNYVGSVFRRNKFWMEKKR